MYVLVIRFPFMARPKADDPMVFPPSFRIPKSYFEEGERQAAENGRSSNAEAQAVLMKAWKPKKRRTVSNR